MTRARSIALVRLSYLLLLYVSPAIPFVTTQCRSQVRIRKRGRQVWHQSYTDGRSSSDPNDDDDMPPTVIGQGSKIRAETFTSTNSVIVEGELDVQRLECGQRAAIHVTSTGRIKGQIYGGILVTVDGKLEGSVQCFELVVGPGGVVTGDVTCKDVIIRPGGVIGGQLSCENMKSERDVFHEMKTPLSEVVYTNQNRQAPPRDNVVAALKAMSDQQSTQEVPIRNMITDDYGHPLIAAATDEQVLSLRRNREEIFATRSFLDKAITRKAELPEWAQQTPVVPKPLNRADEEKYSLKNVLNQKKLGTKSFQGQNQSAGSEPNLRAQGTTLSRSNRPATSNDIPGFLEAPSGLGPPPEDKRFVENLRKAKTQDVPTTPVDDGFDILPDFLR